MPVWDVKWSCARSISMWWPDEYFVCFFSSDAFLTLYFKMLMCGYVQTWRTNNCHATKTLLYSLSFTSLSVTPYGRAPNSGDIFLTTWSYSKKKNSLSSPLLMLDMLYDYYNHHRHYGSEAGTKFMSEAENVWPLRLPRCLAPRRPKLIIPVSPDTLIPSWIAFGRRVRDADGKV